MKFRSQIVLTVLAGMSLLAACDQSRQTADGTTKPGDAGTAAAENGAIADTGSPAQGGGNGTGQGMAQTTGTINQIDRATPDSQAVGKANAAKQ